MANLYRNIFMACMATTALTSAAVAPARVSPEDYGAFKGRSAAAEQTVRKAVSTQKSHPDRLAAFAGEGNAEVDRYGVLTLVEQEDFSLLTAGSESNPDMDVVLEIDPWLYDEQGNIIRDEYGNPLPNPEYEYPWNNMKPEYISGDRGWGVGNAYPAGGMLYFPFSQDMTQGKISTPWLDLSANAGTFVLEFRVRVTDDALQSSATPSMIVVETAETFDMSPTWDQFEEAFVNYQNLSTEWTTFRLVFQGAGTSTLCNIVGQGVEGGMYIDDIKIYSLAPYLATPVIRRHTDFTDTSFTVNWHPVDGAEGYVLNVWNDDIYGERHNIVEDVVTSSTSYDVTDTDPFETYHMTVRAFDSEHKSLDALPVEIFDIVAPRMRKATLLDETTRLYEGGVEEVESAFGYNYFAMDRREAKADGPFVVTDESFTGWRHPLYEDGEEYTKENPAEDRVATLYFPTDLRQQGWYGENFQIYKDYVCLCPFFYEASFRQQQTAWISPELDLSKDGGRISVSMRLAAEYDINYETYSYAIVGLFNWNEEKGDYEQVELVYCHDLNFDWQERAVSLTKGTSRSKIAFFGAGSYGDLYIDDIRITQDYKEGETFYNPFFFRTWQLAEQVYDPTSFEFEVPEYVLGNDIYQKAQAVRMHLDPKGAYDGEAVSPFSENDFVASSTVGMRLVENGLEGSVRVSDGMICIENPGGEEIAVHTPDGKSAGLGHGRCVSYRASAGGIYIVTVGGRSVRIAL